MTDPHPQKVEAMSFDELDSVAGGTTIQSGYWRPTQTVYQAKALDLYVVNPPPTFPH